MWLKVKVHESQVATPLLKGWWLLVLETIVWYRSVDCIYGFEVTFYPGKFMDYLHSMRVL